jgi:uncharacterized membrane protein
MPKKLWSALLGAIIVIVIVGLQSAEHWTFVEHSIEALKSQGPVGIFLAGALMSRIFPLILALGIIVIVIEIWRKQREAEEHKKIPEGSTEALPSNVESRVENSGNSSATASGGVISPTISPIFAPTFNAPNYGAPAPVPAPDKLERLTVNVKFAPWQGQFDKMFLTVTNRSHRQVFEAQCVFRGM